MLARLHSAGTWRVTRAHCGEQSLSFTLEHFFLHPSYAIMQDEPGKDRLRRNATSEPVSSWPSGRDGSFGPGALQLDEVKIFGRAFQATCTFDQLELGSYRYQVRAKYVLQRVCRFNGQRTTVLRSLVHGRCVQRSPRRAETLSGRCHESRPQTW
jgi:hypothetical protein